MEAHKATPTRAGNGSKPLFRHLLSRTHHLTHPLRRNHPPHPPTRPRIRNLLLYKQLSMYSTIMLTCCPVAPQTAGSGSARSSCPSNLTEM